MKQQRMKNTYKRTLISKIIGNIIRSVTYIAEPLQLADLPPSVIGQNL